MAAESAAAERVLSSEKLGIASSQPAALCSVFLPQRNRRCKFGVLAGSVYCVHHSGTRATEGDQRPRCACPLDPRHSVFVDKLESHLVICNHQKRASLLESNTWYSHNLHAPTPATETATEPPFEALPLSELVQLPARIRAAHASLQLLKHSPAAGSAPGEEPSSKSHKHELQCAAIAERVLRGGAGAAQRDGMPLCFVEFGAGNASLSESLALRLSQPADGQPRFVLVDQIVPRKKADARLGASAHRLRSDIAHVDLSRVEALRWADRAHRCAIAKHLCGSATDLALRCLTHRSCAGEAFAQIAIATCCHHRCSWDTYVNPEALVRWGFSRALFPLLCAISHWGVETKAGRQPGAGSCAAHPLDEACSRSECDAEGDEQGVQAEHGRVSGVHSAMLRAIAEELRLSVPERRALGVMAKEVLDCGRALFLSERGFEASVERGFVDECVTPENRLLYAASREPAEHF